MVVEIHDQWLKQALYTTWCVREGVRGQNVDRPIREGVVHRQQFQRADWQQFYGVRLCKEEPGRDQAAKNLKFFNITIKKLNAL